MLEQRRWRLDAWMAVASGLVWVVTGAGSGPLGLAITVVPGALQLAGGVFLLLLAGGRWVEPVIALGAAAGILLAIPAAAAVGPLAGLALAALASLSLLAAGRASLRREAPLADAPAIDAGLAVTAKVALDEVFSGHLLLSMKLPTGDHGRRLVTEVGEATAFFDEQGWLEKPGGYHATPSSLISPEIRKRRSRAVDFEHLSFASDYDPADGEPGRERWLGYARNRTAHAWVLRHSRAERPWLVCIHGYRMGHPLIDLAAFNPHTYYRRLDMNLLIPVLPLHGPRSEGRQSGDGLLESPMDTVHAFAQAIWDIRRMLGWVRMQGAPAVGIYGLSMGGYTAALLASIDDGLSCAIAGIPVSDWGGIMWHHFPPRTLAELQAAGLSRDDLNEPYIPIAPLALDPKVDREHLSIFGGVADRIVPPAQTAALMDHWNPGRRYWYQGSHLSVMAEAGVRTCVEDTLRDSGLVRARRN